MRVFGDRLKAKTKELIIRPGRGEERGVMAFIELSGYYSGRHNLSSYAFEEDFQWLIHDISWALIWVLPIVR
jgi:hypothetical protein